MKIGLLTLYDGALQDVAERTLDNKAAYARRHGYGLIVERGSLDAARPTAWSKILALQKHLTRFDWLFWSDIDALITNPDRRLEDFTTETEDLVLGMDRGPGVGFPATEPGEPRLNTSQFLLRHCAWSRRFLDEVYRHEEFTHDPWWEQQAVMHVLATNEEHRRHALILPERMLMSNMETYQPGDFAMHFGGERKAERIDGFLAEQPRCVVDSEAHALQREGPLRSELDDSWYLLRYVGRGVRPVQFQANGGMGNGGSEEVRQWRLTLRNGQRVLEIRSEGAVTSELTDQGDGQWRGLWRGEGGGEILVTRHRAQILLDLLRSRRQELLTGAEVGVFTGESSAVLLAGLPRALLYLVDAWRPPWTGDPRQSTHDPYLTLTREEWALRRRIALESTQFAEDRRVVIEAELLQAAKAVPGDLDFVFLDADHSYEGTLRAIERYWPKLAPERGLMSGHDYGFLEFPGVAEAVDEFASVNGLTVRRESDFFWWYER
jgi:hypothetical protein